MKSRESEIDAHAFMSCILYSLGNPSPSLWGEGGREGKVVIVKLSIFEFPKELCM